MMSDERTVAQVVNQIPENWCWCLKQPLQWNRGGQGKKRYTAYVSNEYYISDWRFVSIYVDDDDPVHALQSAYEKVLTLDVAKRSET